MAFNFGSPVPTFGSSTGSNSGAAPAAAATTPGVQTPGSAAASSATKGVTFSFTSSTPTFGAPAPSASAAAAASAPSQTPTTPATVGGGGGGFGGSTGTGMPSTPGVTNPLLRNAGATPGLSRASSGGGGGGFGIGGANSRTSGVGAASEAASFLSPPGSIGGVSGGGTRVTFAADNDAIASANAGLRRRRGGGVDMGGGKENDLTGSNSSVPRKPSAGFGPPPKASLMTMSSTYDAPKESSGRKKSDGASREVSNIYLLSYCAHDIENGKCCFEI